MTLAETEKQIALRVAAEVYDGPLKGGAVIRMEKFIDRFLDEIRKSAEPVGFVAVDRHCYKGSEPLIGGEILPMEEATEFYPDCVKPVFLHPAPQPALQDEAREMVNKLRADAEATDDIGLCADAADLIEKLAWIEK